jgi:hypothetical protein
LAVAGLAIVAGAISFAQMTELAIKHGQTGWKAYAFPVSVDGLEIVASLYLVVQCRAGRPTSCVPWVALVVSTLASLAANVAVDGHDPIGKALAEWPVLSMLVSVKLMFSMIDHTEVDQRTAEDDQRPSADRPSVPGPVPGTGPDGGVSSRTTMDGRTGNPGPSMTGGTNHTDDAIPGRTADPSHQATRVDIRTVTHLVPAARAARAALAESGRSLSRDALADAMRDDGHGVSNARTSLVLKTLKAEQKATPFAAPTHASDAGRTRPRRQRCRRRRRRSSLLPERRCGGRYPGRGACRRASLAESSAPSDIEPLQAGPAARGGVDGRTSMETRLQVQQSTKSRCPDRGSMLSYPSTISLSSQP